MITHKYMEIVNLEVNNWDNGELAGQFVDELEKDPKRFCKKYKISFNFEIIDQSVTYYISIPKHFLIHNFPGLLEECGETGYERFCPKWTGSSFGVGREITDSDY